MWCGAHAYRERYQPTAGWVFVHDKCTQNRPVIERRTRRGAPMGYVPQSYGDWRADTVQGLEKGDLVARGGDGAVREGWKPRAV